MNKWKQWHLIWLDHQDNNGPTCNHSAAASPGEQGNGPRQPQLLGPSPVMIASRCVAENYYYHNGVFLFPWYPARLLSASTDFIFQKQKHVFLSLPACVLFVRMDVAHRCQAQTMAASQILFNGSIHHRRLNYSLCCGNQVPSASASYYHFRLSFSSGESSFISPPHPGFLQLQLRTSFLTEVRSCASLNTFGSYFIPGQNGLKSGSFVWKMSK